MMETHYVYFEDEAPSIGAGWRSVEAKIGYKWVRIKKPGASRGTRISRKVWDQITTRRYHEKEKQHSEGLAVA